MSKQEQKSKKEDSKYRKMERMFLQGIAIIVMIISLIAWFKIVTE